MPPPPAPVRQPVAPRRPTDRALAIAYAVLVLAYAAFLAWRSRGAPAVDGLAYLDLSDGWLRGDPGAAHSAYWPPLYPLVLAVVRAAVGAPRYADLTVARLLNVAFAALTLWAMLRLVRAFRRLHPDTLSSTSARVALVTLGSGICAWTIAGLAGVPLISPDHLTVSVVTAAAVLLVRQRGGDASMRTAFLLGILLGLGYLAKSALLPVGVIMVAGSVMALRGSGHEWRTTSRRALATLVPMLALSSMYVVAASRSLGRPTIGASSTVVYGWFVNGVPFDSVWRGVDTTLGPPPPHARRIVAEPRTFAIDTSLGGTYPVWYKPEQWVREVRPRRDTAMQLRMLAHNSGIYLNLFAPLLVGVVALALFAGSAREVGVALRGHAFILLPMLAGLGGYAILLVEPRYIAPFVPALAIAGLVALGQASRRASAALPAIAIAVTAAIAGRELGRVLTERAPRWAPVRDPNVGADTSTRPVPAVRKSSPGETVEALRALGLVPGTVVGVVGEAFGVAWARDAQLRVGAQIDVDPRTFTRAEVPANVRDALRAAGVRWLVAPVAASTPVGPGWARVAGADLYLADLREATDVPGAAPARDSSRTGS